MTFSLADVCFWFIAGRGDENFIAADGSTGFFVPDKEEIQIASSDSEVEIVGVQEDSRYNYSTT